MIAFDQMAVYHDPVGLDYQAATPIYPGTKIREFTKGKCYLITNVVLFECNLFSIKTRKRAWETFPKSFSMAGQVGSRTDAIVLTEIGLDQFDELFSGEDVSYMMNDPSGEYNFILSNILYTDLDTVNTNYITVQEAYKRKKNIIQITIDVSPSTLQTDYNFVAIKDCINTSIPSFPNLFTENKKYVVLHCKPIGYSVVYPVLVTPATGNLRYPIFSSWDQDESGLHLLNFFSRQNIPCLPLIRGEDIQSSLIGYLFPSAGNTSALNITLLEIE